MIEVKKFSGTNYIQIRSEIHKWLEDNPDLKILHIFESHGAPKYRRPKEYTFKIVYGEV